MEFALNEEQRAFQDSARAFARNELAPHAARWDADEEFPLSTIRRAGEMGFLGLYTPQAYGGLELPRLDSALVFEELAYGCTSTAAYLTIHNMVSWMVASFGPAELARAWVPRMVAGEVLGSYCLTEPGAGSDAASLTTRAERQGGQYVLNGSKMFISGAGSTDVLVVMARTGGAGPRGISAFLVPADSHGILYGKKEGKMGWNSQPTRAISFENVAVPLGNRLGEEGEGFTFAMKALDGGRINIATTAVGTAQAAHDAACRYVGERQQFGAPLAQLQNIQFRLADMQTELVAARQMVRLAAWQLDARHPEASAYCAMAKRLATDLAFNVANQALQCFGGYGYLRDFPLERHVRDLRVHQILEGTNDIMRLIIARRLLADGVLENLR
ncbi:acyl-CoA dehydrogenase family protein [Crenobacter intestini]|uniref:Acyl-CoA dehydrogenase n=1 Tax=Crenobacter intestini TaxID=2563443 RepID=A0A4T0V549_9NEIS|nr:acyl-CoA dehydrogenase family protein [Crenobacter intestini]TIC86860.1 acyl-CoA dehydrogenase [Crenobacter intestini]